MNKITFNYRTAFHDVIVHTNDFAKDDVAGSLEKFATVNSGLDHLIGCDYTSAEIMFVHQDKINDVKAILDKMLSYQSSDKYEENVYEDPFYYLEVACNSQHTILLYDIGYVCASEYYDELNDMVQQLIALTDCYISAGSESNDIDALEMVGGKVMQQLQDIDCSHIPNYASHEEAWSNFSDSDDFITIKEDTPQQIVYFYKLLMDNLLYEAVKNLHAQGNNTAIHLYVYEKVRKYLKDK